jgi:hypothetical protein
MSLRSGPYEASGVTRPSVSIALLPWRRNLLGVSVRKLVPSTRDESTIDSETASCINTRNLIKFAMGEVLKNDRKGGR